MNKSELMNELASKCGDVLLSIESLRQWLDTVTPCLELLNTVTEGSVSGRFSGELDVKNKESIEVLDLYNEYTNGTDLTVYEVTKVGNGGFSGRRNLQTISLPNVLSVDECAFQNCENLENINLPKCLSIGLMAFIFCSSLTTINAPLCENIQQDAFYGCSSLTSITLPNCKHISTAAFRNCSNLASIYLPTYVPTLDNVNAFAGLPSNYTIYVHPLNYDLFLEDTKWQQISSHIKMITTDFGTGEVVHVGNIEVGAKGNYYSCIVINAQIHSSENRNYGGTGDKIRLIMPSNKDLSSTAVFIGPYSSLDDVYAGRDFISNDEYWHNRGHKIANASSQTATANTTYDIVCVVNGIDVRWYEGGY